MTVLVFYGSYRSDRLGVRLAHFVIEGFRARGDEVALIDAKAIDLPMLDRMYKEYPKGAAPERLEKLAKGAPCSPDARSAAHDMIRALNTARPSSPAAPSPPRSTT